MRNDGVRRNCSGRFCLTQVAEDYSRDFLELSRRCKLHVVARAAMHFKPQTFSYQLVTD